MTSSNKLNSILATDSNNMPGCRMVSDDFTTNALKAESLVVQNLLKDKLFSKDLEDPQDISKCVSGAPGSEELLMYRVPLRSQFPSEDRRAPDLRGYLLLIAPDTTTPNFSFDRDAVLASVKEEINFKSVAERVEHWNEVSETFGLENSENPAKNPPARVFNSIVVASRLTILPGKEVRLPSSSVFNLRNYEKKPFAVLLLVTEVNAKITTLATPSGAPSSAAHNPTPPSACARMLYKPVDQGDHETVLELLNELKLSLSPLSSSSSLFPPPPPQDIKKLEAEIEKTKQCLTADINKRYPRALNPMDHWNLRLIGEGLVKFVKAGGQLSRDFTVEHLWNSVANDDDVVVEKLMLTRVHYVPKQNTDLPFALRIHLFPESPSETIPHNHHSSCCSMVLTGSYTHKTFRVVQDLPGMKVRVMLSRKYKENSLGELERTQGSLKLATRNEHSYPNVYFLAQDSYHVVAPSQEKSAQQVVSLFLKDKTSGETKFLVEENDDRKLPCSSRIEELSEKEDKEKVLKQIEDLIKNTPFL